jgi:hypothetical protein
MTDNANISPKHDPDRRRWCVEVSLKFDPDELGLDPGVVADIVREWLAATSPGSQVVERRGTPIRHVLVRNRASARKLMRVWGGRIIATPNAGFAPLAGPGTARRHNL